MKGIILAGGSGTRLYPITSVVSKQLLPIYDKPMIYYPLSILMLAKIKDVLIIVNKGQLNQFKKIIPNGKNFGVKITYAEQEKPGGLPEAFIIGEKFLGGESCVLILGDNLFFGNELQAMLRNTRSRKETGATVFAYPVSDPQRYGVVDFEEDKVISIEEKPVNPKSQFAVTGLYFYDEKVSEIAKNIKPSDRGELEITSINQWYLENDNLNVEFLGRGMAWLDTGTFESILEAGQFVHTIEKRQGLKIACLEEIAWRNNWIDNQKLESICEEMRNTDLGEYLIRTLRGKVND